MTYIVGADQASSIPRKASRQDDAQPLQGGSGVTHKYQASVRVVSRTALSRYCHVHSLFHHGSISSSLVDCHLCFHRIVDARRCNSSTPQSRNHHQTDLGRAAALRTDLSTAKRVRNQTPVQLFRQCLPYHQELDRGISVYIQGLYCKCLDIQTYFLALYLSGPLLTWLCMTEPQPIRYPERLPSCLRLSGTYLADYQHNLPSEALQGRYGAGELQYPFRRRHHRPISVGGWLYC